MVITHGFDPRDRGSIPRRSSSFSFKYARIRNCIHIFFRFFLALNVTMLKQRKLKSFKRRKIVLPPPTLWGYCTQCDKGDDGYFDVDDKCFYCRPCTRHYWTQSFRCVTYAWVYDEVGNLLSTGDSMEDGCCAERHALWKLGSEYDAISKVVKVVRVRRKKNGFETYGNSMPCMQCVCAMHFYNVKRVCYSVDKQTFETVELHKLQNIWYQTEGDRILTLV
jgi:cytidine deaminase